MTKPTLILLPGLLCDGAVWAEQVRAFSSEYSILIPDLSRANTPAGMVEAVLRDAPPSFSLAGHSMGGWVALMVANVAPERVLRLALLNTSASPDTPEKRASRLSMISLCVEGKSAAVIDRILALNVHKKSNEPLLREMFTRNMHAFVSQEQAMLSRESCEPWLPLIPCKTWVISANQDKIFSLDDAMCLHQCIKQSQWVSIDDCGHMSTIDAPLQVNDYLRLWLADELSPTSI